MSYNIKREYLFRYKYSSLTTNQKAFQKTIKNVIIRNSSKRIIKEELESGDTNENYFDFDFD